MSFSQTESEASPAVAELRAKLLDGLAPIDTFAEAIDKTPRTVFAYIAQGMPALYIGRTPYVRIDTARDWLLAQRSAPTPVPQRGRPRKAA